MKTVTARLGPGASLALGALAVHELRYLLVYGGRSDEALVSQGHAYLGPLSVVVALVAAVALGLFLRRLSDAVAGRCMPDDPPARRLLVTWPAAATALLAIYVGQEALEGLLAAGHPAGLVGIFGHGGVTAVPLAVTIGGLIALTLRGARVAISRAPRAGVPRLPRARTNAGRLRTSPPHVLRLEPLASRAAGRAPPARSATAV